MKLIRNKAELLDFVGDAWHPYDVDEHQVINEVEYKYPITIEFIGTTDLGEAYKVRSIKKLREIFKEVFEEKEAK